MTWPWNVVLSVCVAAPNISGAMYTGVPHLDKKRFSYIHEGKEGVRHDLGLRLFGYRLRRRCVSWHNFVCRQTMLKRSREREKESVHTANIVVDW